MKITKRTAKLVSDLESILGDNCYNGDSYNGWTDEYGAHFRYPVTYLGTDGKYHKEKYLSWEIDYKNIDKMHYKFGSNELYVGAGLIRILNELEERFGLNFDELTKTNEKNKKMSKEN